MERNKEIQGNENDLILSQMLADDFKRARNKLNPSADSILNSLGETKIIWN